MMAHFVILLLSLQTAIMRNCRLFLECKLFSLNWNLVNSQLHKDMACISPLVSVIGMCLYSIGECGAAFICVGQLPGPQFSK